MSLLARFHPESRIDGFTAVDGTIRFYAFVWAAALQLDARHILDYGAGRGRFHFANTRERGSLFRKHLQDLRGTGAKVTACDVDPVVLGHPCSDEQIQIAIGQSLPFGAETFDVIVADHVFEHLNDPQFAANELLRVLKPGGYICVRTPSRYGYVALLSSLIPNRLHAKVLGKAQPGREEQDVFPTLYRMNTVPDLRRDFAGCEVLHYHTSAEPSYAFGSAALYRMFGLLHRVLPGPLNTILCAFIRKPECSLTGPTLP